MRALNIKSKNLKEITKKTAEAIKRGEVIICPTDTVYGLLVDAGNKEGIERMLKIKKRSNGNPIPIFVKDLKMAKELAFITKRQEEFLKVVWPGKITVVLKRKDILPKILFCNKKTIGLRIPDYKLVNILLSKLNRPLTGTSANISGKPVSTNIKKIIRQFEKEKLKPDLVLDVGNLKPSLPSIVVDLTGKKIKILRI